MTGPSHDGALTGLGRLVRLVLRRDRVRLTVWVVAIAVAFGFPLGVAAAIYLEEYADKRNRLTGLYAGQGGFRAL